MSIKVGQNKQDNQADLYAPMQSHHRSFKHKIFQLITCCGVLWPFGTANTSLSRGMSIDGHSYQMKALVIPAFTSISILEKAREDDEHQYKLKQHGLCLNNL